MVTQDVRRDLEDISIQVPNVVDMFQTNEAYEDFLDQILRIRPRLEAALKEALQRYAVSSGKPLELRIIGIWVGCFQG